MALQWKELAIHMAQMATNAPREKITFEEPLQDKE